jgi:hypothetical protein
MGVCEPVSEEALAFVTLKGGLVVPLEALRLAWSLEDRGATFSVEGEDFLVDGPADLLTETDQAGIRRWKQHLIAIASYQAPEVLAC